ncbi:hypothetical protein [Haloarchaeobius sp. TZWWS8]|uniref:hypothetical protein n=1 Tax=Haloarchaeobius sp. TZWWS8 TaxID=3446121 RepID=UPI003EBBCDED
MSETQRLAGGVADRLGRTGRAVQLALRRRDSLAVVLAVTLAYLAGYLLAVGDLAVRSGFGTGYVVVSDPFSRMFEPTGTFSWEPVALVDAEVVRLLVSPLNIAVALTLALLVGLNIGVTYLAWRHPAACGIQRSTGTGSGASLLAAVPALLSGSACCGPVVLIALGISASGALLTVFAWLLPAGVTLLLASLVYSGGKLDPVGAAG